MNCKCGPFLNEPCSFLIWGIQEYWITLFSGKSWVATQITPILEKLKGSLATDHVIETPCIKCTFRFMKWDQVIEYLIRRCSCAQWEPHWLFDYTTNEVQKLLNNSGADWLFDIWAHLFRIWTPEVWLADGWTAKLLTVTCIELPVYMLKIWQGVVENECIFNFDDYILEVDWVVALPAVHLPNIGPWT